jgi:hypothetical protein
MSAALLVVAGTVSAEGLLNTGSYWRHRIVWETEETRLASDEVGHYRFLPSGTSRDKREHKGRYVKRERRLEGVRMPASKLKRGINVLALSIHHPPANHLMYTHREKRSTRNANAPWGRSYMCWNPTAKKGTGVRVGSIATPRSSVLPPRWPRNLEK